MTLPQPLNINDLRPFLANPEQLREQTVELQLAIANYPATPTNLLEILVNSSDPLVAEAANHHVNWAGEITENWHYLADTTLPTKELGQNDRLAVELLKIAPVPDYFLSESVPSSYLTLALKNPHLPLRYRLKYLERLARESNIKSRFEVAEFPETPPEVLEILAGDVELSIRMAAQSNPCCPPESIELVEEQLAVAQDWNTDSEQLATLGESRWDLIRLAVAQNPATSVETLMQLAGDGVFKIKLAVAKNPQTPANVLAVLVEHWETQINSEVARHPHATESILHQLFPTQKDILRGRENLPASILERFFQEAATDEPIKNAISQAKNQRLYSSIFPPMERYRILLEEDRQQETARADKFISKRTPLTEVMKSNDSQTLCNAARSSRTPIHILEQLAKHPDESVRKVLLDNPALPSNIMLELAYDHSVSVRNWLAGQNRQQTPAEILEILADDESEEVRGRVAENPQTKE